MEYPQISFGTYRLGDKTYTSLEHAFISGYRSIDTASLYKNEHFIGQYLNENQINRDELWITSKLNPKIFINTNDDIIKSINKTLEDLNTKYLDLYLIHCPKEEHIIKCWDILESYYKQGIFKHIGVSNFDINHIEIIKNFSTIPIYTNQIELSPFIKRPKLINYMNDNNIIISAHSSLAKGEKFSDITIQNISKKYNKTPAQIMLKWALINNYYIMPRSSNEQHIKENLLLDFEINDEDINELNNINITHITHPQYVFTQSQ
jgi:diketogulonate reductase-like aldo/keto reductase